MNSTFTPLLRLFRICSFAALAVLLLGMAPERINAALPTLAEVVEIILSSPNMISACGDEQTLTVMPKVKLTAR